MAPSLLQAPRRSAHAIVALTTAADLGCCASSTTPPPHLHRPRRRRVRPAGLRPDIMDDDAFLISPHQRDARTMILAPGVTLTHPGLIPQTIISSLVVANDFAENGSIIFPSSDLQTNRVLAVHQADCSGAPVYGVEMQLRTATVACPHNNSAVIHESSVEEAL